MISKLTHSDRARVLEIVKDIWEGDDYIPEVFDKWVDSQECYFMGLWKEETLIGIDNLRKLSPTVGWMEGMRIDPVYQGRGYGRELGREMLKLAIAEGFEELYFSTYFDNVESIRLNESFGFERIAVFTNLMLELPEKAPDNCADLEFEESVPEIRAFFNDDWSFIIPDIEDKGQKLQNAFTVRSMKNLAVLSENSKASSTLEINYIELSEDPETFIRAIVRYGVEKGFSEIHTMVRESEKLDPFLKMGFEPFERTHDVFIYRAIKEKLKI